MNKHKFIPVRKDRLFYDRYEFCLDFYLEEVSCLRQLDHACIDDTMERRKQWREIAQQRWVNGRQNHGVILRRTWKEITEKTIADLHSLAQQLLTAQAEYKLVVSVNHAYIYTNDLYLIDQISSMPELTYKTYKQARVTRPKDTIVLKKPQYAYRSYLKMLTLTVDQKDNLMDFLHGQQHIRMSPGLQRWFDLPFNRSQDYFFVDHDTENWLTMLNLVHPGIVRKTMHIIPAK